MRTREYPSLLPSLSLVAVVSFALYWPQCTVGFALREKGGEAEGLTDFQEEEGRALWKSAFASLARLSGICTFTKYAMSSCEKR